MKVQVRFDRPGWFLGDAKISFTLDRQPLGTGSFRAGCLFTADAAEGMHEITGTITSGFLRRSKTWTVSVPSAASDDGRWLEVRVSYSRVSGNFRPKVDVEERRGDTPALTVPAPSTATAAEWASLVASTPSAETVTVVRPPPQRVIATWALLGVLVVAFIAELAFPVDGEFSASPSVQTLIGLGGLFPPSFAAGEWYRAITCAYLHSGFLHILMNGFALVMVGAFLESVIGWRWFIALYAVGTLGGSVMSLALNDGRTVSVGASGAIMGLFAAGLWIAQTLPGESRFGVSGQLLRVLVPSLLPIFPRSGERIDIGAHLGGALAGAVAGGIVFLWLRSRRSSDTAVAFPKSILALGVAALFMLVSTGAWAGVATTSYPKVREEHTLYAQLLPDDQLPEDGPPNAEELTLWLTRYPDDPRVLIMAAGTAMDREEWPLAHQHLDRVKRNRNRLRAAFPPESVRSIDKNIEELEVNLALLEQLIPIREFQPGADNAELWKTRLPDWTRRFPNDPRVRSEAAWAAIERNDFEEAARYLPTDWAEVQRFEAVFPNGLPVLHWLRLARGVVAFEKGRIEEANADLTPICSGAEGPEVQAAAQGYELCGAQSASR